MRIKTAAVLLVAALALSTGLWAQQTGAQQPAAPAQGQRVRIVNGPVVEFADDKSATIAWSTDQASSTKLMYGTDPTSLKQTAQAEWGATDHRIKLTSLQPNTIYYFKVESGESQVSGTQTSSQGVLSFRTAAAGQAPVSQQTPMLPLYRLVNSSTGAHFYTTFDPERQKAASIGYSDEGVAGYISPTHLPDTVPLFRLVSASGRDHIYTTDRADRDRAINQSQYRSEGIIGFVAKTQQPESVPIYRLVSQQGDHFYTTSDAERAKVLQSGARDEGITGYIWTTPTRTASGR